MANITAKMVKDLRDGTGLPMMECKQALTENDGDVEAAKSWLRKKHKGKMAAREGRETGEGRIGCYIDEARKTGAFVELRCETAPVAVNELFVDLANAFARHVADIGEAAPDAEAIRADPTLDAMFTDVYGKLRETMKLVSCRRVNGEYVTSYVHHDGKSGALIALDAVPTADGIGPDLCMHTTFSRPIAIDRSGVPEEAVQKIRTEAREIAIAEGKPEGIVDKIVEGKVNAFFAEGTLMEQLHARTDVYGKKKVRDVLKEAGVGAVVGLAYMKIGG